MERHRIAIIIPALNESATIAQVVAGVGKYGLPIVVDDGSDDDTAKVAESAGATVIRTDQNLGYDAAINAGFRYADDIGCEYAITIDADGQHDPALVMDFIEELNSGADLVIGSRDKLQRVGEYVFSWIASIAWGVTDPLCGAKAYRLGATYKELGHFDSYNSIGTELAIYAAKRGKDIRQRPIQTRCRIGASRFGASLSANHKILRALWYGVISHVAK